MTKEGKTITQAILTVFIYGLGSFLNLGQSIFPFPLNQIIFLIVAIYFATIHFKNSPYTVSLILFTSSLSLLSSEFYWEIALNSQQMTYISENEIPLKFGFFYQLFLSFWMIITFFQNESKKIKILGIIPLVFQFISIYFELPIYGIAALLTLFIYSILQVKHNPLLYLWILLFILECTKLWHLMSLQ